MIFKARDKYQNISTVNSYWLILIGLFFSALSYFIYQNLLITISTILNFVLIFWLVRKKPREINIEISDKGFVFNKQKVDWQKCLAWNVVDLGGDMEFVIQTGNFLQEYWYFYISEQDDKLPEIIDFLSQELSYKEDISVKNGFHNLLRIFGLS